MACDLLWLKRCFKGFTILLILFSFHEGSIALAQPSSYESAESGQPYFEAGELIYTDIDTLSNKLYVLLSSELWKYDLSEDSWTLLRNFDSFPEPLLELDFGYDPFNDRLLLWSRGVGILYQLSLEDYSLERIDQSSRHKNQFGHIPFLKRVILKEKYGQRSAIMTIGENSETKLLNRSMKNSKKPLMMLEI